MSHEPSTINNRSINNSLGPSRLVGGRSPGGVGEGWGGGRVRGVSGIPLNENQKVSWFLGFWLQVILVSEFLVSWFQRFKTSFNVSERYLFHITKLQFHFFDRYRSHIQDFQAFIRRLFGIFRRPSFPKSITNGFTSLTFVQIYVCQDCTRDFLAFDSVSWGLKR